MAIPRARIKDVFNELGVGKNGYISLDEFSRLCDYMGMDDMSTKELKQLYNDLDTNGDGKVSNNEFMEGMFRKETPPKKTPAEEPKPAEPKKEDKVPTKAPIAEDSKPKDEKPTKAPIAEDSKPKDEKPTETPVEPKKMEDNNKGKSIMSDLFSDFAKDKPHHATRSGASDWLNYLDPEGTGYVSGPKAVDFFEKLGVPDGSKVLEALNFDPKGQIQPSDLSHALERELHKPEDNPLHQVAVDALLHSTDKFWNDNHDLVEECQRMAKEVEEMKAKVKESQDDQEAMAQKKDMEIKILQEANRKLREESSKEVPAPLPVAPPSDLKEDKEAELKKIQDDLEKQVEKLKDECEKLKEKNSALENEVTKLKKDLETVDKKSEKPNEENEKPKNAAETQQPQLKSAQSFDIDDKMSPEEVREKVNEEVKRIQRLASTERKDAEGALMVEISELEKKHEEEMEKMKEKYEKEKADMLAKQEKETKDAGKSSSEAPKVSSAPVTMDTGSDPILPTVSEETSEKSSEVIDKSTETEKPPPLVEDFTEMDKLSYKDDFTEMEILPSKDDFTEMETLPSKDDFTEMEKLSYKDDFTEVEKLSLQDVSTETEKLPSQVPADKYTDTENLLETKESSTGMEIKTADDSTETEESKSPVLIDGSMETDKVPSSTVSVETDKLPSTSVSTDTDKLSSPEDVSSQTDPPPPLADNSMQTDQSEEDKKSPEEVGKEVVPEKLDEVRKEDSNKMMAEDPKKSTDEKSKEKEETIDDKEIERMKQEIKDLSDKYDNDIANLKKAHEEEMSNMKEESGMIKSSNDQKLEDANKKVAALTDELSQVDNIVEDLEKKLNECDQKISNLEQELASKDKNIADKDENIANLEKKLEELSTNMLEKPGAKEPASDVEKVKADYESEIARMKKDHETQLENLLKDAQPRDPMARRSTMPPGATKDDETLPKFSDLLKGFETKISDNVTKPQKKLENIHEEPPTKTDPSLPEVKDDNKLKEYEDKIADMKKQFEDEKKKSDLKHEDELKKQRDAIKDLQEKINKLEGGDNKLPQIIKDYENKIDEMKKEREALEKKLLQQAPSDVTTRHQPVVQSTEPTIQSTEPTIQSTDPTPPTSDIIKDYEKKIDELKSKAEKEKKDLKEAYDREAQRTKNDFQTALDRLNRDDKKRSEKEKDVEEKLKEVEEKLKDLENDHKLKMRDMKTENDRDVSELQKQVGRRDGELKEKYEDLLNDIKNRKEEEVRLLNDVIKNLRKDLAEMRKNVTSQPIPVKDVGFESLQKKHMEELSKENKKLREENLQFQADLDSKQDSENAKTDSFQKLLLHNADINAEKDLLKDQLRRTLDQLNKVTNTLTALITQHRDDKLAWTAAKEKLVDPAKHQELGDKVSKLEAANQSLQAILERNQSETGKVLKSTRESYDRELRDLLKEKEAVNSEMQKLRRAVEEKDVVLLQVAEKQMKGDQLAKDLYVENSRLVKYLQQLEKQNLDANSRIQMLEEKCRVLGDLVRKICPAAIG